jgi:arsenate reductase-like glutaredoxin family protein
MITIYHNPRRGKSRAAMKILEEKAALGRPPENVLGIL